MFITVVGTSDDGRGVSPEGGGVDHGVSVEVMSVLFGRPLLWLRRALCISRLRGSWLFIL